MFAEAAEAAGLPPGTLNVVTADREVSELLVREPRVDKITFTGSTGRSADRLCLRRADCPCTLEPAGACPPQCCRTTARCSPAIVSENMRPMLIAGLAKLAEEVKLAAPIQAPTAAGADLDRPEQASAMITMIRPRVATISEKKCAALARCLTETLTAFRPNMRFAMTAPAMHPAT